MTNLATNLIHGTGAVLRDAALGAWLGLWILGVGGRIAMRAVALALGQPPAFDMGGTLTVVASGTAAGAAGALLYAASRAAGGWLAHRRPAEGGRADAGARPLRLALFAALLALVTARGLQGSPGPTWAFWLLVAAYGAALEIAQTRRARDAGRPTVQPSSLQTS